MVNLLPKLYFNLIMGLVPAKQVGMPRFYFSLYSISMFIPVHMYDGHYYCKNT